MKTYEKYLLNEVKMTGGDLIQFKSIFKTLDRAPKGLDVVFKSNDKEFGFVKKNKQYFDFEKDKGGGYVVKLTPLGKKLKDAVVKK